MPIRFRCAYCNQLLGIARRKAGTVVRCPTCAGQLVVPNVDTDETEAQGGEEGPLVFERNDFEELLNPGAGEAVPIEKKQTLLTPSDDPVAIPAAAEPPAGAWGTHAEPAIKLEQIHPALPVTAQPAGIVLSPTKATLLLIAVIVAVALAFGGGWLLGYFMRPAESKLAGHGSQPRMTSICSV
jgi:hypothetical protein